MIPRRCFERGETSYLQTRTKWASFATSKLTKSPRTPIGDKQLVKLVGWFESPLGKEWLLLPLGPDYKLENPRGMEDLLSFPTFSKK